GFRAVQAIAAPTAGEALVVPRGVIEALALKDDASADAVALPGTPAGVRAPADTDEPPGGGHLRADGRLEAAKADGESGTAASATAEVPQSDGHAHIASSARYFFNDAATSERKLYSLGAWMTPVDGPGPITTGSSPAAA